MENYLSLLTGIIVVLIQIVFKMYIDRSLSNFQSKLNELNFYKKHYYEREFEIYKEINKAVLKCSQNTSDLFRFNFYSHGDKNKEGEQLIKLLTKAVDSRNELTNIIHENYPFYPEEIFNQSLELKDICDKTISQFRVYKIEPYYDNITNVRPPKEVYGYNDEIKKVKNNIFKSMKKNVDNYRKEEKNF